MYFGMNWTEAFRNVSKIKKRKKDLWKKFEEAWKEIHFEILLKLKRKYATVISGLHICTRI